MAGIQKSFLSRVRTRWQRELPFLKPVHLSEVPQLNKGTNFLCDHYFAERGRAYFIQFDFSPKRFGEFTIGATVSDSLTRSILEHGMGDPSPTAIGMYAIGPFIGAQTRRWALIDHNAQGDELFRSLGVEPNKCQSSLLTLPGRADKGLPCRASYALSTLGPCITS
jgi:hypothetical protein